jgi:hypothetical protein
MPTALESRAALGLVTGAAVDAAMEFLSSTKGSPQQRRADLLRGVPSVVGYYSDGTSALAADFYDDERSQVRTRTRYAAQPIVVDRGDKLFNAIAWSAAPLLADAEDDALKRLAEVVSYEVAQPYRQTIIGNRQRDPDCVGWQRVCVGGCGFCQMVAAKGAVYKSNTANFACHPHCHCSCAPVFGRFENGKWSTEVGQEASVVQYAASKRRRTAKERATIRDWVAYYEGR